MKIAVVIYLIGVVAAYGLALGTQKATWPQLESRCPFRTIALAFAAFSFFGFVAVCFANLVTPDVKWNWRLR